MYIFTDLKVKDELPNGRFNYELEYENKMKFGEAGPIIKDFREKQILDVFNFSYSQSGNLNQKRNWNDGTEEEKRPPYEMFLDTTNGKVGEEAVVTFANNNNITNRGVDYSITGKNVGDMGDVIFEINGEEFIIGCRTVQHFSNLLLLEGSKSFSQCHSTILTRIKATVAGKNANTLAKIIPYELITSDFNDEHKRKMLEFIKTVSFEVEIAGKIFKDDYEEMDKKPHRLYRGDNFMGTFIQQENRYAICKDLRRVMEIKEI
jgi:hypothetical protein